MGVESMFDEDERSLVHKIWIEDEMLLGIYIVFWFVIHMHHKCFSVCVCSGDREFDENKCKDGDLKYDLWFDSIRRQVLNVFELLYNENKQMILYLIENILE